MKNSFDCRFSDGSSAHVFQVNGSFLLYHLPSLSLFEIDNELAEDLRGGIASAALEQAAAGPAAEAAVPSSMVYTVVLTHACNLRCSYCYDRFSCGAGAEPKRICEEITRLAAEYPRLHIQFMGGEPLLAFDKICSIVDFCEANFAEESAVSFSITTNGCLLTDEIIRFLNRHSFSVCISADGCMDGNGRLVGSDEKVFPMEKAVMIASLRSVYVRSTIAPAHIRSMYALYCALREAGVRAAAFAPAIDSSYCYTAEDAMAWNEGISRIAEEIYDYGMLECRLMNVENGVKRIMARCERKRVCSAGCGMMAVDTDGTRYPCHRLVGRKEFSCAGGSLPPEGLTACEKCWCRNICTGVCMHDAAGMTPSLEAFLCAINEHEAAISCWAAVTGVN